MKSTTKEVFDTAELSRRRNINYNSAVRQTEKSERKEIAAKARKKQELRKDELLLFIEWNRLLPRCH